MPSLEGILLATVLFFSAIDVSDTLDANRLSGIGGVPSVASAVTVLNSSRNIPETGMIRF